MSWLSKLNPLKWIKDALVSDFVGGQLRHLLTLFGGVLLGLKIGSPEDIHQLIEVLTRIVTSGQFVDTLVLWVGAVTASVKNKKVS